MRLDRALARVVMGMVVVAFVAVAIVKTPSAAAQEPNAAVDVRGNAFIPGSLKVLVGTTVTWTQKDQVQHTVTADDNQPESWDEGLLLPVNAAGVLNEFEHTFENLGTTTYHCEVHANMIGEVTVVESFDSPFVTVNANDANEFSPELVEINATEGILWINSGTVAHTVTFEDAENGDLGELAAGEQVRLNFTKPGSFRYRCTYHSGSDFETGMVGKVVVGGNASFPTVVIIEGPTENTTLNGTANVTGRLVKGAGQPDVTALEYAVDDGVNWTAINTTDLAEFQWTFALDTTMLENGNHTLTVRAMANGTEAASDELAFQTDNGHDHSDHEHEEGGGLPSLPALVVLALLGSIAVARRRDFL